MSHLWTYDWLLASSEIGNALCCDCFVKHLHSIYYKGQIALAPSSKNIWSQSPSETVSFRHTFILCCHYRQRSTGAFSFRNGNVSFYFLQTSTAVIFRCLSLSQLNVISLCNQHAYLIKLSYFISCISFYNNCAIWLFVFHCHICMVGINSWLSATQNVCQSS